MHVLKVIVQYMHASQVTSTMVSKPNLRAWSSKDSLYGSRQLAGLWANTTYEGGENCGSEQAFNQLDRIQVGLLDDTMVLPPNPYVTAIMLDFRRCFFCWTCSARRAPRSEITRNL